jgi:hypothetical protein
MTVNDAIALVRGNLSSIRALPKNLVHQRQQLAVLRDAARAAGQVTNAQAAQTRLDEALSDLRKATVMNTQLDQVAASFESVRQMVGLGILPVLPIAAGVALVAVAVSAGYLLKSFETRTIAIEQLAKGTLTPAQYAEFQRQQSGTGLSGMLGDAKNLLLIGVGVVVVLGVLKYAPLDTVSREWT